MKNKIKNQTILIVITMLVFMMGCEPVEESNTAPSNNSSQITGTFSYGTGKVSVQASTKLDAEISPTWDGNEATEQLDEDNIEYSIASTDAAEPAFASTGLEFSTSTGTISGTASATLSSTEYTITATGKGKFTGEITGKVRITIGEEVTGSFIYTSITATKDIALTEDANLPQWTGETAGHTVEYTISPDLPTGLSINATTGAISGTATVPQISTEYTITATGTALYIGSKTTIINIAINASSIGTISYASNSIQGIKDSPIAENLLKWSDDAPNDISATFAINTAPATDLFDFNAATGLVFDTSTGAISGTPNKILASTRYTITASAKAPYIGSTSVTIQIVINTPITGTFSYTNITATKDTALIEAANLPQWKDATAEHTVEYTIFPDLPTGLSINATTGAISGTATVPQISTEYTITATGTALYIGSKTTIINIAINASSIGTISYASNSIQGIKDSPIAENLLDWSEDAPNDISATLAINTVPATDLFDFNAATGLVFDTSTGAISGTPNKILASTRYTITANAKAPYIGSTSVTIQIVITTPLTGTFSYTNISATKDIALTEDANLPQWTVAGQIVEYTIFPDLPTGLSINATTGAIIGTPTAQQASAEYTIMATAKTPYTDPDPKITATVQIAITTPLTGTFNYGTGKISVMNSTALDSEVSLTWDGVQTVGQLDTGNIEYSIAPTDSAGQAFESTGLNFNTSTGAISGTASATPSITEYIITATAKAPYTDPNPKITATISIEVSAPITGSFSYSAIAGVKGAELSGTYEPQWKGDDSKQTVEYTITPDLPTGLTINSITGAITGTLSVLQASTDYTIMATAVAPYTSPSQPITATISIRITALIDGSFSYNSTSIVSTEDAAIADLTPSWSDRTDVAQKLSYVIHPGLPKGLNFDPSTGVISGTPIEVAQISIKSYTIEAKAIAPYTDPDEKITTTVQITVNPLVSYDSSSSIPSGTSGAIAPVFAGGVAPSGLTYSILTTGSVTLTTILPTINNATGEITVDTDTTAGTYEVSISGDGYSGKNNTYFYVTTSPTSKADLQTAISTGVGHFGDTADFNYILTNGVTDISRLFSDNQTFNGDISRWDTSNVTTMYSTFSKTSAFNGNISQWNTSNVTILRRLFYDATAFNNDLPWNTSNVEDMREVFYGATSFNGDISNWDTSKATSFNRLFRGATAFNKDLPWDTSNVEDMSDGFYGTTSFDGDISNWNTSKVTNMFFMFFGSAFSGDLSVWDTGKVTNMQGLFNSASSFNSDLSNWNTSNVTIMAGMFAGAAAFNIDISRWDMSKVTSIRDMFSGASAFDQNLDAWSSTLQTEVIMTNTFTNSPMTSNTPCWYSLSGLQQC